MLLEPTTLERRLAEILATSMPGHGGNAPQSDENDRDDEPGSHSADGEPDEEQPDKA